MGDPTRVTRQKKKVKSAKKRQQRRAGGGSSTRSSAKATAKPVRKHETAASSFGGGDRALRRSDSGSLNTKPATKETTNSRRRRHMRDMLHPKKDAPVFKDYLRRGAGMGMAYARGGGKGWAVIRRAVSMAHLGVGSSTLISNNTSDASGGEESSEGKRAHSPVVLKKEETKLATAAHLPALSDKHPETKNDEGHITMASGRRSASAACAPVVPPTPIKLKNSISDSSLASLASHGSESRSKEEPRSFTEEMVNSDDVGLFLDEDSADGDDDGAELDPVPIPVHHSPPRGVLSPRSVPHSPLVNAKRSSFPMDTSPRKIPDLRPQSGGLLLPPPSQRPTQAGGIIGSTSSPSLETTFGHAPYASQPQDDYDSLSIETFAHSVRTFQHTKNSPVRLRSTHKPPLIQGGSTRRRDGARSPLVRAGHALTSKPHRDSMSLLISSASKEADEPTRTSSRTSEEGPGEGGTESAPTLSHRDNDKVESKDKMKKKRKKVKKTKVKAKNKK